MFNLSTGRIAKEICVEIHKSHDMTSVCQMKDNNLEQLCVKFRNSHNLCTVARNSPALHEKFHTNFQIKMKFLGVEFQGKTCRVTTVAVVLIVVVVYLALGFRLAATRTCPSAGCVSNQTENGTSSLYQRAVDILTKYPIVDG